MDMTLALLYLLGMMLGSIVAVVWAVVRIVRWVRDRESVMSIFDKDW
ncbi:MAG: hypothetical protein AB8B85_02725 [Paracoccaceae bacterium]